MVAELHAYPYIQWKKDQLKQERCIRGDILSLLSLKITDKNK